MPTTARALSCFLLGTTAAVCTAPFCARPAGPPGIASGPQVRADGARQGAPAAVADSVPGASDTIAVHVRVRTTLYDALERDAASLHPAERAELAWRLADVLRYRLDLTRELRSGMAVDVLYLRAATTPRGSRVGNVLAARIGSPALVEAIRFEDGRAPARYLDADGHSLRGGFLRSPLPFPRISSRFGLREHPILGGVRLHRGIDYAAASGTAVHAVADGTVVFVGVRGGYGNLVEVRHRDGITTRYGHLGAFAPRLRAGTHVRLGQHVGSVGSTGLSTGPHLHFETLVNGVPADPRSALPTDAPTTLTRAERAAFDGARARLLGSLERRTLR